MEGSSAKGAGQIAPCPEWVDRVGSAMSATCPVSRQFRKCWLAIDGVALVPGGERLAAIPIMGDRLSLEGAVVSSKIFLRAPSR